MHTNIAARRTISAMAIGLALIGCSGPKTAQEAPKPEVVELQGVTG